MNKAKMCLTAQEHLHGRKKTILTSKLTSESVNYKGGVNRDRFDEWGGGGKGRSGEAVLRKRQRQRIWRNGDSEIISLNDQG